CVLLIAASACGDEVGEARNTTSISGRVVDDAGAPIADAEVSSTPPTQTVVTDQDGRFRLNDARFTISYMVTAQKDGFQSASVSLTPSAVSNNDIRIVLPVQQICVPGQRRCAVDGVEAVEVCNSIGNAYERDTECDAEQTCTGPDFICRRSYRLTVRVTLPVGVVRSMPLGINCGQSCEREFPEGTEVTLQALPFSGGNFLAWAGDCAPAAIDPVCTITMSADRSVIASFAGDRLPLVVSKEGDGEGRVTSAPAGIDCGGDCLSDYDTDSTVNLTAAAEDGSEFAGWGGDCETAGAQPTCQVTMDVAKRVTARFQRSRSLLTVARLGTGGGQITSSPAGIDCGATCSAMFDADASVTLTATPDSASGFAGWGDDCAASGAAADCTLSLNQARTVNATFEPFYFFVLPADPDCVVGLSLDGAAPLAHRCGGADNAQLVGDYRRVTGRTVALDRAYLPNDASPVGGLDTLRQGPQGAEATFELTVRRDGAAFDGSGRAILISDIDAAQPVAGFRWLALDDGSVALQTWQDGQAVASATVAGVLPAGTWVHLAATVSTSQGFGLFADGQRVLAPTGALTWTASSSTAWVGAEQDGASGTRHRLNGTFDEVRLSRGVRNY
ncbi:MAG: carboxypeptidase regulatory-like domain-containing protein, partial [Myxococcota bacterium]